MIFARALCVVLLLYSVSFGDSLSLKNDTDSEERTVINLPPAPHFERNPNDVVLGTKKMAKMEEENVKPYAEDYRGFLLYLLREIWQPGFCKGPFVLNNVADAKNTWNAGWIDDKDIKNMLRLSGLYFFFLSTHNDDKDVNDISKQGNIYPFYVGITDLSFRRRFSLHISQPSGLLNKIRANKWATQTGHPNSPRIVAYVINMPLPVAKLFESLFLSLFDFAMNKEENGSEHKLQLQTTNPKTVQNGREYFVGGYNKIKTNLENMISLAVTTELDPNLVANYDS